MHERVIAARPQLNRGVRVWNELSKDGVSDLRVVFPPATGGGGKVHPQVFYTKI